MRLPLFAIAAFSVSPAFATFVVQCTSRLTDDRLDPIVNPGGIASHVHVIAGGNAFGPTMTYDEARASGCSTCNIKQDLSNYWTPKLYYQAQNGSLISVPIDGDDSEGNMGGMAIYYLPRGGPDNDPLVPFPKGFRMFAGDSMKRVETQDFAGQAVRHRCVGGEGEFTSLPNKTCPQGVRTEVVFPSCWDGVNLDSDDHKTHVSYPLDGNYDGGRCPSTHPKHMLTLFYEVTYRTDLFSWSGDKQPFVFANGDPTGYGYHGDFVNGWDVDTLAEAIQKCPDGSNACEPGGGVFDFSTLDDRQACKLPQRVVERVSGVLDALPGCNPVTLNPVMETSCNRNPAKILSSDQIAGVADLTSSKGWKYMGCGVDDPVSWGTHALSGGQQQISGMTIDKCVNGCSAAGFTFAGMEYSSECYCGNTLDQRATPKPGVLGNCDMKCAGDDTQNCGGSKAITIYQKCNGGACQNAGFSASSSSSGASNKTGSTAAVSVAQQAPEKAIDVASSAAVVAPSIQASPISATPSEPPAASTNTPPLSSMQTPTTLETVTQVAEMSSSVHTPGWQTSTRLVTYTFTVADKYWA